MGSSDPLETPVAVSIYVRMPIPASYSKARKERCVKGEERPVKKPDIDNIAKSILDPMNGIVFIDDGQVVRLTASKVYSTLAGVDVFVVEELP